MRIWLATVGEPLPTDGNNTRLLRSGQLAEWLTNAGHEVVFWTGTYDHSGKRLRADETQLLAVRDNYTIVMLAGRHYRSTTSFARFMNHVDVARSFRAIVGDFPRPDIVLSSW